jgi:Na+/H+ antiporter NhaC
MQRTTPIVTLAALALLLWFLPQADETLLAAIDSGTLVAEPCTELEGGLAVAATLGDVLLGEGVLEEPAEPGGDPVLRLRGFRLQAAQAVDLDLHQEMMDSIVRHLRSHGAEMESPVEFQVVEDLRSDSNGLLFEGQQGEQGLSLTVTLPGGGLVQAKKSEWRPPTRLSLLPPLVAIALAILLRKPVPALLAGVFAGSILARTHGGESFLSALFPGSIDVGRKYIWNEVVDTKRMMIVSFVIFMLAMVGVVTRAGGIQGLMDRIARLASDARKSQIATWLMGLVIFFDDYANTILVGTTMRPLTDRFKVAREKLAYIVDSTAAPVAGISILSTWIAFEVSTFSTQLPSAGLATGDGYAVFLQTLPYRFYCLFTLFFVGLVVFTGRDFGPMLKAERRARAGQLLREGAKPMVGKEATDLAPAPHVRPRSAVAIWPVLTFVLATLGIILKDGDALGHWRAGDLFTIEGATAVLYDGSGFAPLMWASLAGYVLALILGAVVGLGPREMLSASWSSLRSMGIGLAILYLAWSIGSICSDLGTAAYLSSILDNALNPLILPLVLFLLSGFVAFATGSSWSTMTILLPLVVGISFRLGESVELGGYMLMVISIGAVLEGAIFGDHCSPISDTTVMSSIASASDHIDHVRTQTPYALVTMVVAMVCGYLPATILGLSPWLSLILGCAVLTGILFLHGQKADPAT